MKLLVFGAGDAAGAAIVHEALERGHDVTAVGPAGTSALRPRERLEIVAGDPADAAVVAKSVIGKDAVLVGVEPTDRRPTTRFSDAVGTLVPALRDADGTKRLVVLSDSSVDHTGLAPLRRLYGDLIIHRRHHNPINDMRRMEKELGVADDLDWTVLRPFSLRDGPRARTYRSVVGGHLRGGRAVSRRDLAHYAVAHLSDTATYRTAVELAY